jgi:hypothetical protein
MEVRKGRDGTTMIDTGNPAFIRVQLQKTESTQQKGHKSQLAYRIIESGRSRKHMLGGTLKDTV